MEGFIYGINSFDQWGVELGKVLAKDVRGVLDLKKGPEAFNAATKQLLEQYLLW